MEDVDQTTPIKIEVEDTVEVENEETMLINKSTSMKPIFEKNETNLRKKEGDEVVIKKS